MLGLGPYRGLIGGQRLLFTVKRAAGEPVEASAIRDRIQQDPLGALRERLAAG